MWKHVNEYYKRKKKKKENYQNVFECLSPRLLSNPYKHRMCNEVHLKYVIGLRVEKTSDAGPGKMSCDTALSCLVEWMKQLYAKAVMEEKKEKKLQNTKKKKEIKKDVLFAFLISDFPAWTV